MRKSRRRLMDKDTAKFIDPPVKDVKGPGEAEEIMTSYVYNRPYVRVLVVYMLHK